MPLFRDCSVPPKWLNVICMSIFLRKSLVSIFTIFVLVVVTNMSGLGQTIIVNEGFNNSSSLFSLSGGSYYTGNSAGNDTPANSPFAVEGTHSRGISYGTATLTSSNINTTGYTNISLSLRAAAFAINDNTGFENTDYIRVEISENGGTSYATFLTVTGNNSSNWSYSATGVATTTYGSAITYAPSAGGTRTTDGYSTLIISGLPAINNLRVRITMTNSTTAESWVIDNFKIIGLQCSPISTFPYTQNFDSWTTSSPTAACTSNGNVSLFDCWNNDTGDNIDWDIYSGSTASSGTGPTSDHTTGSGKYLYTESSGGCTNQTGFITMPTFDFSSLYNPELTFWYNMYGASMGTLSIQISTNGGTSWSSNLWSLTGDQGSAWQKATIDLSAYQGQTSVKIRYTSLTGGDYQSDIAIDDVTVSGLNCIPPDIPTLSASQSTICAGNSTTLSITSGNLNSADHWQWFSGSCGGTLVGQGTSISVSPSTTTTYYVKGEGNSCDGTVCGSVTVTINLGVPDFNATITDVSCPSSSDGQILISNLQSAIDFQNSDFDYIDLGSNFLTNLNAFTLEGWIKVNKATIGNRIGLFGQNDAIEFGFINNSTIECWTPGGGSVDVPLSSYPSDNGWHHIAAVGNGLNITIYIDGVSVGSGGGSTSNYGSSSESVRIGASVYDPVTTTTGGFTGQIAKVGFWNTALNSAQLNHLVSGFTEYIGSEAGLIAGYNFFEGSGTTISSLPAGNSGSFVNSPGWTSMFTYSWTKTGDGSFSSSNRNLTGVSSGEYNMAVLFGSCTRAKSFTVNSSFDPPTISSFSTPSALCVGDSFSPSPPSVNNNGSTILSQGWEIETSVGSGLFTSLSVPHTNVLNDDGKKIRYFATNNCGTSFSNEVTLTVNSLPVATISANNNPVCLGDNAEFTITGTNGATVTYNINGGSNLTTILNGGTSTFMINGVSADQTINLVSVEIGTCSKALSENSTINIIPAPTATISGNAEICSGTTASISVAFTGSAPWSINYTDGTTPVTVNNISENPYAFSVSPFTTTTYSLTSMNDASCNGAVSGSAFVIVDGEVLYSEGNDTTICPGGTANLKINLDDKSAFFDGINGRISIGNDNNINTSNWQNRTVSFWFNANDVSTRQMLYEEGAQVNGFSVYLEGGYINVHAWETNTTWGEVKTAVNQDTWYNVAFVFDNNASDGEYFKGYLNGNYFGGNSDPAATNGMNAHSGDVNIGMNGGNIRYPDNSTDSSPNYFSGNIDEFKLWNRSLTINELQSERWNVNNGYQSGSNLIVYFNFNSDTNPTVADITGGNNGTISGNVTFETNTPFTPAILWSPGSMTGFTENISPTSTTIYTYTLTHPFQNCETTGSITVTVDSPIIPSISGNGPVCPGEDAVFTITGTPGDVVDYDGDANGTATIGAGGTVFITIPAITSSVTVTLNNLNNGNCDLALTGISETIIPEDNTPPTPDIATLPDITDECSVTSLNAPTATDDCMGSITATHDATLPITHQGTTTVTWTYDDGNGNTSTQPQNIIINDITDPTITCPAEINQSVDPGSCTAIGISLGTPVTTDNCSIASVTNNAPASFSHGTKVVTWTATDVAGNMATCNQNVNITQEEEIDIRVEDLGNACQNGETGSTTTIIWDITKISGTNNWTFDYEIKEGSVTVDSNTNVSATGNTQVSFGINNETDQDKIFTITISNVQDNCGVNEINTGNNSDQATLYGVPATSEIITD